MRIHKLFYLAKPFIPRSMQIALRRFLVKRKRKKLRHEWPIYPGSGASPKGWKGWPEGKRFAVILTHDVELAGGHNKCETLMHLEKRCGFVSSFNFVPERYEVSPALRALLADDGFEVGVHGLNHDGKLYESREVFNSRAKKINEYIEEWQVEGFRSPAMHHNLDWIRDLDIEYDASTFDTDPFEPQPDGYRTIFPFVVEADGARSGYVELPYTLPQDFTLFIILQERNAKTWKEKVDWIAEQGGMVLVNVHPDYIHFGKGHPGPEEFPASIYEELLNHISSKYEGEYWHVLPKELAKFWRTHHEKNQQIHHKLTGNPAS